MDERTVDAEDKKLWPIAVERHFIEVLLEVDAKGNMPQGQFKTGTWTIVMNKFNKHTNRDYNKTQLTQKYQRMKGQHRTFSQLIAHTGMGWDPISNTVTASEETWATAFAVNHKFKELKKKGLKHYDLLGKLFNSNTATGFLQISSTQLAPNSDEERELDAAFLSRGYMSMSTKMVWMMWRSCPHRVKPKAGGKLKSGQLNHLIQAEKGRKGTPLSP
ncbi:l10-interacting myb domain-containing protein [Quercus suber]|uniref:L10-interacting myb domain-containing protein n=1 Tax=Quercus suber TaxID=58331 RepID=A0AAW0KIX4_QUESU